MVAVRPATLWAAVAPVLVGSALAVRRGVFRWDAFVVILAAAILIQIGVNFANDLSDAVRGADPPERIGPPRAVATGLITPQEMKRALVAAFGLAALLGVYLIVLAGWVIAVVGVLSIAAALAYTGGPFPYGYHALGELFVFVFFGLVATVGTRYVYDQTAPLDAWLGGIAMGGLATAILLANNIRDIDTDAAAGKTTLAVRLGRKTSRTLFTAVIVATFVVTAVAAAARWTPPGSAAAVLSAPLAVPVVRTVQRAVAGPELITALKSTARLQIVFAILFAVGCLV